MSKKPDRQIIAYIRVSTGKQDLDKQRHLLRSHAQSQQLLITEFIDADISSPKSTKERRVDELLEKLHRGDTLLVAELSRLGRNMLQTLNIINDLTVRGVDIHFVRQPELSTTGPHTKLLMAIYRDPFQRQGRLIANITFQQETQTCESRRSTLIMVWCYGWRQ